MAHQTPGDHRGQLADLYALRLPSGDQDALLIHELGRRELRVLGLHKFIEFWWKYETFAEYLAHWFRLEESKRAPHEVPTEEP